MFLYCLSSAFPTEFRFLRAEACLTLCYTPLLTQGTRHTVCSKYLPREWKSFIEVLPPTYLFYRWGSILIFNFSPLVFRVFICLYWGSAIQYPWFASRRKAGLGPSSSPKAESVFPVENPSTYHLTIRTSPCSLPNLPLHVLMFLQIWLPLGGAQQIHSTPLLCQDFHDPRVTILRLP